ncbi:hydroxyacid dehydrogenase, partial [Escherichia coli]|nr:hydroxyacid dehydrogenase [Escherichia coli]
VIQHLNKELKINMMLGGAKTVKDIQATQLYTDASFNQ